MEYNFSLHMSKEGTLTYEIKIILRKCVVFSHEGGKNYEKYLAMPEEVRQKKVNRTTASNHKNVYAMSLLQEITGRLKNGILMKDIPEQL